MGVQSLRKYAFAFALSLVMCFSNVSGQRYRVCAQNQADHVLQGLGRSDDVGAVRMNSNVECALGLQRGIVDFSMFSVEEALFLSQVIPDLQIISPVRHTSRLLEQFQFQSVAVVRATHTGGLEGLRDYAYCHPGFGNHEQRWSQRVLQHFEQRVVFQSNLDCSQAADQSPAESDARGINAFFRAACRPGPWSRDTLEDARLKSQLPELCRLCDRQINSTECVYNQQQNIIQVVGHNDHHQALACMESTERSVAYVAWAHVVENFSGRPEAANFALLCEDGSLVPFTVDANWTAGPSCAWISQPWDVILARGAVASNLLTDIRSWMPSGRSAGDGTWVDNLDTILFREQPINMGAAADAIQTTQTFQQYFANARPIPAIGTEQSSCHDAVRWCTVNAAETRKCNWVRQAAFAVGARPAITCVQGQGELDCLQSIQDSRSDFTSIDSNYGYLARTHYALSTNLLLSTTSSSSSRVVALLKEANITNVSRFENLRDGTACFPEYGGIAWVAFLRTAHERGVISDTECDYARAISTFFRSSCAPGAGDNQHLISPDVDAATLCSACRINDTNISTANICPANASNLFYRTAGALSCIAATHTDVAFIEQQYLTALATEPNLRPENFRVLCRNNTLALNTGFNVNSDCLLANVVDGEIISRRNWNQDQSVRGLLLHIDSLFGTAVGANSLIEFPIFSTFNGTADLLFKDSAIGFFGPNSSDTLVTNYISLFSHLDTCNSTVPTSGNSVMAPLLAMLLFCVFTKLIQ